jgi:hypothetical protein
MRLDRLAAALLLLGAGLAQAQFADTDPDATESDAPPPPALRTDRLIPIEVVGSSLHFGVDPASVAVSRDGIVRYVVLASGTGPGGAVNGLYEGIRCRTGEVRTYARYLPGAGWTTAQGALWHPLQDPQSRHSLAIARTGACMGQAPNRSAAQIVQDLAAPVDHRFELTR